jgi:di/tricarboxylate transporter
LLLSLSLLLCFFFRALLRRFDDDVVAVLLRDNDDEEEVLSDRTRLVTLVLMLPFVALLLLIFRLPFVGDITTDGDDDVDNDVIAANATADVGVGVVGAFIAYMYNCMLLQR